MKIGFVILVLSMVFSVWYTLQRVPSVERVRYVKTDRGFIVWWKAQCELGMVLNSDGDNILDEDGRPIQCSGYVYLTDDQVRRIKAGE